MNEREDNGNRSGVGTYWSLIKRHPILYTFFVIFGTISYIAVLYVVLPDLFRGIWPFRALQIQPELNLVLLPAEEYTLGEGGIAIKRFYIVNIGGQLSWISMKIRTNVEVSDVKIASQPSVPCEIAISRSNEPSTIIHVSCENIAENQRTDIALVSTKPITEDHRIVVEAIGKYGRDRHTGASAAGSWKRQGS